GIGSLGASVAGLTLLGGCQFVARSPSTPTRLRRIGFLYSGARATLQPWADGFVDRMRQLGWVEGGNLTIERRFADGHDELLPELRADVIRLPVEVIVAAPFSYYAAHDQTNTIPIVMVNGPAPELPTAPGLYNGLARPGGNVTGTVGGTPIWVV